MFSALKVMFLDAWDAVGLPRYVKQEKKKMKVPKNINSEGYEAKDANKKWERYVATRRETFHRLREEQNQLA